MDLPATGGDEAAGGTLPRPAGDFSPWLRDITRVLAGEGGAAVPCGDCTDCCTSAQFIQIAPDETDALAHIPAELLFPAPRMPRGHVLMGYDDRGCCPMFVNGRCSIYEHRPRTCRTYDCRVFPAVGIDADADKPHIAQRAKRWVFAHPTHDDEVEHAAVRAAATFLDERRGELAEVAQPVNATHHAVLAIEVHHLFLRRGAGSDAMVEPAPAEVEVEVSRRRGSRRR